MSLKLNDFKLSEDTILLVMVKKKKLSIKLKKALKIDQVSELKQKFDEGISNADSISIVSDTIESIDLAGIQLIQYFIKQSELSGKEIVFDLKMNEEQVSVLKKCGFDQLAAKSHIK
ncbi:MAG: hypothetical protein JW894_03805 [Bacteroidales bacterium]|nr:hypothetical protein [Bacteroidales bacterium]